MTTLLLCCLSFLGGYVYGRFRWVRRIAPHRPDVRSEFAKNLDRAERDPAFAERHRMRHLSPTELTSSEIQRFQAEGLEWNPRANCWTPAVLVKRASRQ